MDAIDPLLFPDQGIYCLLVQAQALWPTVSEWMDFGEPQPVGHAVIGDGAWPAAGTGDGRKAGIEATGSR